MFWQKLHYLRRGINKKKKKMTKDTTEGLFLYDEMFIFVKITLSSIKRVVFGILKFYKTLNPSCPDSGQRYNVHFSTIF